MTEYKVIAIDYDNEQYIIIGTDYDELMEYCDMNCWDVLDVIEYLV